MNKMQKLAATAVVSAATFAMTAGSVFAASAPDFQHLGFPKVVAAATIRPGHAAALKYGKLVVHVPAGAFSSPVRFELLEGAVQQFAMRTPKGENALVDFAFKATNTKTGALIGKFAKPIIVSFTSPAITARSEYWNVAPDGKLLANPLKPKIAGHTLTHGNLGAPVGWIITTPAMAQASSPMEVVIKNGKFNPAIVHLQKGQRLKFLFDGMGTDHFVVRGVVTSPLVHAGQSWTYVFNKPGTYHVQMKDMGYIQMTVVVK
ncbi:MAG: cupredoxin domain-containing protein [Bacilli bacterium]